MFKKLFTLTMLSFMATFVGATPLITLGPPVATEFSTFNPGSVRVETLGGGDAVDLQLEITIHPTCVRAINIGLVAVGDGGTFANHTDALVNGCNGDASVFDVRLTGDGAAHGFDIEFVNLDSGVPLASVSVELLPEVADTDGDGIRDFSDNCTVIPNSDQRDTNNDGYGNACDPDTNNDGIVAFVDIASWVPLFNTATTGDADFDGNGVANFLDFALFPQYFLGPPGPSALAP